MDEMKFISEKLLGSWKTKRGFILLITEVTKTMPDVPGLYVPNIFEGTLDGTYRREQEYDIVYGWWRYIRLTKLFIVTVTVQWTISESPDGLPCFTSWRMMNGTVDDDGILARLDGCRIRRGISISTQGESVFYKYTFFKD